MVAVDLLWARGVGYLYYLISPTVGESLTTRSAFRMLGFIRPGKYRSVHNGPLYYVIIPQWATRDGELFRMISYRTIGTSTVPTGVAIEPLSFAILEMSARKSLFSAMCILALLH